MPKPWTANGGGWRMALLWSPVGRCERSARAHGRFSPAHAASGVGLRHDVTRSARPHGGQGLRGRSDFGGRPVGRACPKNRLFGIRLGYADQNGRATGLVCRCRVKTAIRAPGTGRGCVFCKLSRRGISFRRPVTGDFPARLPSGGQRQAALAAAASVAACRSCASLSRASTHKLCASTA